ncbi:hypothetical protein C8N24_2832 [Solirubrobacter pauli]|uniref:Uncharacterized protein n=1 Tax=Solirubrobacter pauli TaxID=166793 RepID=A0A660LFL4_9ACTN|nr:hypothetical protein [Solirubrobacter pauli]RKQ92975.1 hypothetical protein C8N24_2832 [Solirubrobacter pauli]
MSEPAEPLDALRADVEKATRERLRSGMAWIRKWTGLQLIKLLGGGAIGVGALWVAFPYVAAGSVTVIFVLLSGYTLYLRKQLVDERTTRRWAWVGNKRLEQRARSLELALAEATLALVGQPQDRESRHRINAPGRSEFVAALRYAEGRARAAALDSRPQPANARTRRPAVPQAPDVSGVRRRRELLEAEISKLEAEIQNLAVPGEADLARAAEEAERSFKQQRDAAHEADRVARGRYHAGKTPSPATSGQGVSLTFKGNGDAVVGRLVSPQTPEQIARGEQESSGRDERAKTPEPD